jgi:hypothetical protein
VAASCTEICAGKPGGRSCSKICLSNIFSEEHPERKIKVYVVIDDQSNCSLAKPELFNLILGKNGAQHPYTLKTCAGTTLTEGRYANDLFIKSTDGSKRYPLPTVIECTAIPDNTTKSPHRTLLELIHTSAQSLDIFPRLMKTLVYFFSSVGTLHLCTK